MGRLPEARGAATLRVLKSGCLIRNCFSLDFPEAGPNSSVRGPSVVARASVWSAPFFVFVIAGRFYFLSAYLFETYARLLKTLSKPSKVPEEFGYRDLYRSLQLQDLAFGLNPFFPKVPRISAVQNQGMRNLVDIWSIGKRLGAPVTLLLSIVLPFGVHIAFTAWFWITIAKTLPCWIGTLIKVMYVVFLVAGAFMVASLRRSTGPSRDSVRALLSEELQDKGNAPPL